MSNENILSKIDKWLNQLAMEIALIEEGKDSGQLPIRELLSKLVENTSAEPSLGQLRIGAVYGLKKIDTIMEELRPFKAEDACVLSALVEQFKKLRKSPQENFTPPQEEAFETFHEVPEAESVLSADHHSEVEPSISMSDIVDADLLGDFMTEAAEHLENIELGILQLEENPNSAETLNSVFRSFHTLKGGAGFLQLIPIQTLAHELESLLDNARQGKLQVTSAIINLILDGRDIINRYILEIQQQITGQKPPSPILIPTRQLIQKIVTILQGKGIEEPSHSSSKEASSPEPKPMVKSQKKSLPPPASNQQEGGKHEAKISAHESTQEEAKTERLSATVVKVDTQKLDSLFDMVGEMVIAQSMIAQAPELMNISSEKLNRNLALLSRITNELQKTAMSLRMVPIRATFQKMNRVVRDVSAKAGKQVNLRLHGEDTELDRTIVEEISDPLIHMVRNSVDHGIEPADMRQYLGKPPIGQVTLDAFHQGGNIVIQIQDDGAGLNKQKILNKAIEKGLASPSDQLRDEDIFAFIFAPGFSTAEKVTDISGRGVGMDVVKKNIEKLRGKIEIQSVPGKGSTFNIYLPLTLAIIEGLIIRVADQRYIIPTLAVRESFRPSKEMLSTVQQRGEMINVRGKLLPMMRLHKLFDIPTQNTDPTESISVVVESAHRQRCIIVDQLIGKQEVVIKSLADQFKRNPYLAGAAIMGDGQVGLILDTSALVSGN